MRFQKHFPDVYEPFSGYAACLVGLKNKEETPVEWYVPENGSLLEVLTQTGVALE